MGSNEHIVHNRRMDVKPLPRYTITCETDGETHKGTYWVAARILAVSTGLGVADVRGQSLSGNSSAGVVIGLMADQVSNPSVSRPSTSGSLLQWLD